MWTLLQNRGLATNSNVQVVRSSLYVLLTHSYIWESDAGWSPQLDLWILAESSKSLSMTECAENVIVSNWDMSRDKPLLSLSYLDFYSWQQQYIILASSKSSPIYEWYIKDYRARLVIPAVQTNMMELFGMVLWL